MILLLNLVIFITPNMKEFITLIGFVHWLFNQLSLFIAWSIQLMPVDLILMKIQEHSRRKMELSNAWFRLVSQCSFTFLAWDLLSLTLRRKDSETLLETKCSDFWSHSCLPFSFSLFQDCILVNNTRNSADLMEKTLKKITGNSLLKPLSTIFSQSSLGYGIFQPFSLTASLLIHQLLGASEDPEKFHLTLEMMEILFSCKQPFSSFGCILLFTWTQEMDME